jgi:exonuclease SbcD
MKPFRFVHTADLHLDSPFEGLTEVAPDLQEILREATFQAFQGIVDLCLSQKVQCLLIAGDLHDAADRNLRSLARMKEAFNRLAEHGIAVFICHGNHDPLSGWGAQFTWPENVHVFGTHEVEARPLLKDGTEVARIYGISYETERVTENLAKSFQKEADAPWSIGLLHANVGNDQNHMNYAPCELQDLLKAGMDYWALGHIHAHRVLHSGGPMIVYPGNPQGRHTRETGARGCCLIDVDEHGDAGYEFIPVDLVRWHHDHLPIDSLQNVEELLGQFEDRMAQLRRESGDRGLIVRWSLTGRGPLHRELTRPGRLEDLLATLRDHCGSGADLLWSESIKDFTGRELDLDALRREENLLGDFLRLSSRDTPALAAELETALKALFADARFRRHLEPPDAQKLWTWIRLAEQQGIDRLMTEED